MDLLWKALGNSTLRFIRTVYDIKISKYFINLDLGHDHVYSFSNFWGDHDIVMLNHDMGNLHIWDINLGGVLSHDFGFIFLILQLQRCVGSAIVAMGPEKLLALLPISVNPKDLSCSNAWLIPILKEYVVGSSLGFFMEHIMPLAQFLQKGHEGIRSIYCT